MPAQNQSAHALLAAPDAGTFEELKALRHPSDPVVRPAAMELADILEDMRRGLSRFIDRDEPPVSSIGFVRPAPSDCIQELRLLCMATVAALEDFSFGPGRSGRDVQEKMAANQLQAEIEKFHRELKQHTSCDREIVESAIDMRTMLGNVEVQLQARE